jgi:hypothetical protein
MILSAMLAIGMSYEYPVHLEHVHVAGALFITSRWNAQGGAESLVLKNGAKTIEIGSLSDLKGAVTITSPAAALEFVRLDSTPATWDLMNLTHPIAEIMAVQEVDQVLFGFNEFQRQMAKFAEYNPLNPGMTGLTSRSQMHRLVINSARASKVRGGFRVERTLLVRSEESRLVLTPVIELITRDGGLRRHFLASKEDAPKRWRFQTLLYVRADLAHFLECEPHDDFPMLFQSLANFGSD